MYSVINIGGLAIAVTCVLLAVLFIHDERSYDRFHAKGENLYRIVTHVTDEKGERKTVGGTGQTQGPAFSVVVPEIENYARLLGGDIQGDVVANDRTLNLQMLFADESFFNLFSFPLIRGDAGSALKDISSAVITESVAKRFFNSVDVIGKTIFPEADPSAQKLGKPLVIAGVAKDIPKNSSVRFEILMPLKFLQLSFADTAWLNQYLGTFVLLKRSANLQKVVKKFDQVFASHASYQLAESKRLYGYDPEITYGLQHITDIHLNPLPTGTGFREGGIVNESHPLFSWMFMAIALFILIMAAANFINISIATSLKRAREVGVRKVTGASRRQIILQFLVESGIVCLLAFLLAIVLTNLSLPLFNELARKQLEFSAALTGRLVAIFAGVFVAIMLITGLYPAYVLSAFRPKEVLYNKQTLSGRNLLGKALVVLQFSLAVFFIIATIIYYRQMDYVRTKDLGYDPYQVVRTNIRGDRDYGKIQEVLRSELSKEPSIQYLSFGGGGQLYNVKIGQQQIEAIHEVIDEYRLPVMQIKLKVGRNISSAIPSDKQHAVIVNESFVKAAKLASPIGTQLYTNDRFDKELKTIVGVVKDYHTGSLHEPIRPVVMLVCDWDAGAMWIRIGKLNQQKALKAIAQAYKKAMPTAFYEYSFMDELNAKAYEQEQRWQKIISIAALLSIIVCCLGLIGLAHLAAQQRTKEVGIRKVLGATVAGIATLLTKDFVKPVLLSMLLSSPIAWWMMNRWLQDFAYRVSIGWWMFMAAGLVVLFVAIVTVGIQALKAATANPVKNLRTE
jgi:putative ABC transport system permease protein